MKTLLTAAEIERKKCGVSRTAIQAMKLAGFRFTNGRTTTWASVLKWQRENPHFRACHFYGPHRYSEAVLDEMYPGRLARHPLKPLPSSKAEK